MTAAAAGRYTSCSSSSAADLSTQSRLRTTAGGTEDAVGCSSRINDILTLPNARERSRPQLPSPYLKPNGRFSFLSLRYFTSVIRYDTVRLFLQFSFSFFPRAAIVHLSISLANVSKRLIMRCGAPATRMRVVTAATHRKRPSVIQTSTKREYHIQ